MEDRLMRHHKITLFERASGMITGVKEVLSFDVSMIVLDTEQGLLEIQGENLHVTKLTVEKGEIEINGLVTSMVYNDKNVRGESGEGFWRRLLR